VGIGFRMTQLRLSKISNIEGPEGSGFRGG